MDRENRYKRNQRKKLYRRRRIFALILAGVFVAGIILFVKALKSSPNQAEENLEATSLDQQNQSVQYVGNLIKNNNFLDLGMNLEKKIENENYYALRSFRQQRIVDHAMGRITRQKNLKKEVFLTFDDGPSSESTGKVLDILKENDIKATFFVVGANAEYYPEVLKRIYNEGHSIGIHTYDHNYKKIYSSPDALQEDIENCKKTLKSILGEDFETNLYRFPGGSYRENKEIFVDRIQSMGYVYFDWNALNGDAEGKNPSESYLINRFNETRSGYNVVLSLMHDTNAKTNTISSLPEIIRQLKEEGYTFKGLGDINWQRY